MHRLLFLLAVLVPANVSRSGLCGLSFDDRTETESLLWDDTISLLPSTLFDECVSYNEPALVELETEQDALPTIDALVMLESTDAAQLLPMEHYLTPIAPPAPMRGSQITTVAVPLPPAAVGGAIAVATLLGGPLLSGRRLRRKPARTFR